jgi:hypothetical protein
MTSWPTIRARFLLGRPGAAMARVLTPEDLASTIERIQNAYQSAQAAHPWAFHLIVLRHDLHWTERLVNLLEGQDAVTELERVMESTRRCNEADEEEFVLTRADIEGMIGTSDIMRGVPSDRPTATTLVNPSSTPPTHTPIAKAKVPARKQPTVSTSQGSLL